MSGSHVSTKRGWRVKTRLWAALNLASLAVCCYSMSVLPYATGMAAAVHALTAICMLMFLWVLGTGDTDQHTILSWLLLPLTFQILLYSTGMKHFCYSGGHDCWFPEPNWKEKMFMACFSAQVCLYCVTFLFVCTGFVQGFLDVEEKFAPTHL